MKKACMQRMRNYFHSSLVVKNLQRNGSSSFETSKRLKVRNSGKREHVTPLDCSKRFNLRCMHALGKSPIRETGLLALEFLRLAMIQSTLLRWIQVFIPSPHTSILAQPPLFPVTIFGFRMRIPVRKATVFEHG